MFYSINKKLLFVVNKRMLFIVNDLIIKNFIILFIDFVHVCRICYNSFNFNNSFYKHLRARYRIFTSRQSKKLLNNRFETKLI